MSSQKVALLSVFHKEGIVEFAQGLVALGWALLASGGTAKALREAGLTVTDTAQLIANSLRKRLVDAGLGFYLGPADLDEVVAGVGKPILGHKVVTLSREISAALLANSSPEEQEDLDRLGIPRIDLVCGDLYPLEETIRAKGESRAAVIESTDIGGPTMLRAAAKGDRIVICDPSDRARVLEALRHGGVSEELRRELAAKAEGIVARYCLASARYLSGGKWDGMIGRQVLECKYGENAHQTPAAFFTMDTGDPLGIDMLKRVLGTDPSYNNLCDIGRMFQTLTHIVAGFAENGMSAGNIAIGVKHGNACGAAQHEDPVVATERMIEGDPLSLSGGLVILNFPVTEKIARTLLEYGLRPGEKRRILDGVVAPLFEEGTKELLKRHKDKCRLLENSALANLGRNSVDTHPRFRYERGGFLRQPNYTHVLRLDTLTVYPAIRPDDSTIRSEDKVLAWAIGATSNSNTITLVKHGQLIGNGVNQQDRVGAGILALTRSRRAGHNPEDAVAYSDSFFPYEDGPEALIHGGVKHIVASSGSIRDNDVIAACKGKASLSLGPDAEIRGFFGH